MQGTDTKIKKQKIIGIVRDINISKDDLIDYLKTIGVEATINTTLEMDVVFRTGEKYRYKAVPQSVFEGLMSAESHGQYMHKRVLGRYDYQRLD